MMRSRLAALGVALACLSFAGKVEAQEACARSAVGTSVGGTVVSGEVLRPALAARVAPGAAVSPQGALLPYSYYAVAPSRARIYVEYGAADRFPFYGRAYGNPGDRWSWYTLSGGSSRYLARYYSPPLR